MTMRCGVVCMDRRPDRPGHGWGQSLGPSPTGRGEPGPPRGVRVDRPGAADIFWM